LEQATENTADVRELLLAELHEVSGGINPSSTDCAIDSW
jgi:hypothetical protein